MLDAVRRFIRQRPGLKFGNYGDVKAYRQEARGILRDYRDAQELLRFVAMFSISAEDLTAATRAYSGRLQFQPNGTIRYCAGQYWPTEYRAAVCSVLAQAILDYWYRCDYKDIPKRARQEFGRGIAARWFR